MDPVRSFASSSSYSYFTSKRRRMDLTDRYEELTDEELWSLCDESREGIDIEAVRHEFPILRKYIKDARESEGFDVDVVPLVGVPPQCLLPLECCRERFPEEYDGYMDLAKLAIRVYNKEHKTKFEVEQVEKVNSRMTLYDHYYMTFTAVNVIKAGRRDRKTFQAKVSVRGMLEKDGERKVEFCRLKLARLGHDSPCHISIMEDPCHINILEEEEPVPNLVPLQSRRVGK